MTPAQIVTFDLRNARATALTLNCVAAGRVGFACSGQ
jgi:hypothetical protein